MGLETHWLGLQDYSPLYQKQKDSLFWPSEKEEIWGLEHRGVITLGRRARADAEIDGSVDRWPTTLRSNTGASVPSLSIPSLPMPSLPIVSIDRGGLATIHNEGQLVIYPLMNLAARSLRARDFICNLLKITTETLNDFGVKAQCDDDLSGLFVGGAKICFLGLRISQGRSYHGLSLNVANDLTVFKTIRACGVKQRPLISLHELGLRVGTEEVFKQWSHRALQHWGGSTIGETSKAVTGDHWNHQ